MQIGHVKEVIDFIVFYMTFLLEKTFSYGLYYVIIPHKHIVAQITLYVLKICFCSKMDLWVPHRGSV